MKIRGMYISMLSAAALAGATPLAASAGELYLGAGVGSATYENAQFVDCVADNCNGSFNDSDTAWNIFVGYELSPAVAVELGYSDYGSLKDTLFDVDTKVEPTAVTLQAVGTVPVWENLSAFGKVGIAFLSTDFTACGEGCLSDSANSQDLVLGGGLDYRINQFRIRLEGQWVNAEDTDKFTYFGIAGIYGFKL